MKQAGNGADQMTITIRIKTNKNGKRVAHYFGRARRWLPMSLFSAEMAIVAGVYMGCLVEEQS